MNTLSQNLSKRTATCSSFTPNDDSCSDFLYVRSSSSPFLVSAFSFSRTARFTNPFKNYLLIILISLATTSMARTHAPKDTLFLNLGIMSPGDTIKLSGNKKKMVVMLENAFHFKKYLIEVKKEWSMLPPLENPASLSLSTESKFDKDCALLEKRLSEWKELQSEDSVLKSKLSEITIMERREALSAELKKGTCKDLAKINDAHELLNDFIRATEREVSVLSGETVTITVKNGKDTWTWIIEGDSEGKWFTTYGFAFPNSGLAGATYHTESVNGANGEYKLVKSPDNKAGDFRYVPAVFFSYLPRQKLNSKVNCSATLGLGYDLTAPTVLAGLNLMYRHNIGISLGVVMEQQHLLKKKYTNLTNFNEPATLTEPLDFDQLHDKVYRPNLFIAFNFRFAKSPFGDNNEK